MLRTDGANWSQFLRALLTETVDHTCIEDKDFESFIRTDFVKIHLCTEQAQTQQPPAQASATSSNFLAIKSALSKRRNSPATLGLNSELSKRRGSPAGNEI